MKGSKSISLVGYASDTAGAFSGSKDGPIIMQRSPYLQELSNKGMHLHWENIFTIEKTGGLSKLEMVAQINQNLAQQIKELSKNKKFFTVIGGDHSSAIGTWSGVYAAIKNKGPLGLIWIDAHMDSHTPESSPSGNIHGMPVACLLGYGDRSLTTILDKEPKLQPEHICIIGIRSFEAGEAELLEKLNVRIFFMEEVKQRGLDVVMQDALKIVTQGTAGFGISIDIDSIDPKDAPGTGTSVANGILADQLYKSFQNIANDPRLLGLEIAEFDPHRDKENKTEKLVSHLIASLVLGSDYNVSFKDSCFNTRNVCL